MNPIVKAAVSIALTAAGVVASSQATLASQAVSAQAILSPVSPRTSYAQAARLTPPAPYIAPAPAPEPAPPSAPQQVNLSTCKNHGQAAMTITMPDIGYMCPVYTGGQPALDSGEVVLQQDWITPAHLVADNPGEQGTLFIAGHRSSHGGAFAAVPNLPDGAIITVSNAAGTARYRVVYRVHIQVNAQGYVLDAAGQGSINATIDATLRVDSGGIGAPPRLLLQTCDGARFRWMIYADIVT